MTNAAPFVGEDMIILPYANSEAAHEAAQLLRKSGEWEAVVAGLADVTVRFDPLNWTTEDALAAVQRYQPDDSPKQIVAPSPVELLAHFSPNDALDGEMIAAHLGIATDHLGDWLAERAFRVAIMGFQPGFPYLDYASGSPAPPLSRLAEPRQHVPAGSIGFLGNQLCIYAFDGAGGWPIIGRIEAQLFEQNRSEPVLLRPGQTIRFVSAS